MSSIDQLLEQIQQQPLASGFPVDPGLESLSQQVQSVIQVYAKSGRLNSQQMNSLAQTMEQLRNINPTLPGPLQTHFGLLYRACDIISQYGVSE